MVLDTVRLLLFPALMAFAASSDLLTMTISNRVSLALIAGFVALAAFAGMSLTDMLSHAGAGFSVLVVGFALFSYGWIGGGDAKLAATTALWLGFDHLPAYLLYASLFGGILTFVIVRFRDLPLPEAAANHGWIKRLHSVDSGVPYGIALAASALLIYPSTIWMQPG